MAVEQKKETETIRMRGGEGPVTREELRALFEGDRQMPVKTWRPTTGGVLEIVAGYLNILTGVLMIFGLPMFAGFASFVGVGIGFGILLVVLGIISVIGGSYALRRRMWGWSLAGAITSLFPSLVIVPGTLSLVLVALSKPEFKK